MYFVTFFMVMEMLYTYSCNVLGNACAPSLGKGNLDKNGITSSSPTELRRSFPLALMPFFRLEEAAATGGP